MQTRVLTSQKTSSGIDNLYIVDWKEGGIRAGILYWYPVTFKDQTKALLDVQNKVNAMSQGFAHQLSLNI